ncbi:hypothetical protein MCEPAE42_01341 [Candidatus Nanopelagicaceae bacterium]
MFSGSSKPDALFFDLTKGAKMTPPQKPEWMELTDADSVPTIKKKTRLLPAMIASVALAIVGVGAIAAQISDEAHASAIEKLTPQATTAAALPVTSKAIPVSPKQPSIASLPKSGGGENEGRGEGDDYEGEDD